MTFKPTFQEVREVILNKGYKFFTGAYSINIIGIRCSLNKNIFDDTICILYYDAKHEEKIYYFPATTLAGHSWLKRLINPKGTFILKEGQFLGVYKEGLHKGRWGLVQNKPLPHYRDNNKDLNHDLKGEVHYGMCAANIHDTNGIESKYVNRWSAGCQVINKNFDRFKAICKMSFAKYGKIVSYTLINKNDFSA